MKSLDFERASKSNSSLTTARALELFLRFSFAANRLPSPTKRRRSSFMAMEDLHRRRIDEREILGLIQEKKKKRLTERSK